ncbi:MAG: thiamine phosphate synthase [Hahellaceae bacterium]|nr:thiamine phosphate synthase [Hahellaceae bacterium]
MNPACPTPGILIISASDSAGCSGLQADLRTAQGLMVHPLSVVTATTAQTPTRLLAAHPVSIEGFTKQLEAVKALPFQAVKIGALPDPNCLPVLKDWLATLAVPVVLDPVLDTSSGQVLGMPADALKTLLPYCTVITPNVPEALALTGLPAGSGLPMLAKALSAFGCHVYLKGGHAEPGQIPASMADDSVDYLQWPDNSPTPLPSSEGQAWLLQKRGTYPYQRGTGCTLSTALAAFIARGETLADACVLANAYVAQGLKAAYPVSDARGPIAQQGWPLQLDDYPTVVDDPAWLTLPNFAPCRPLGLYPVVDSVNWIKRLLPLKVPTCQLRIKQASPDRLKSAIQEAVGIGKAHDCQLFINDYWQLAIETGAYGVHLGQEDLSTADLTAIARSGLRLGISTHGEYEWARARSLRPSYLAIGAIFNTQTKPVRVVGLERLTRWVPLLQRRLPADASASTYSGPPLTAIGGIDLTKAASVLATGVGSIAVVSAITRAVAPETATRQLLDLHLPTHR